MITGSVHKKHGYYHAVFRHNGKQIWKSTGIKETENKRKAEKIMYQIIEEFENDTEQNGDMLLVQYLRKWVKDSEPNLKPSTYEDYEKRIYGKIIPYFEPKKIKLKDLKPSMVTGYLNYLKTDGRSDGTGGLSKKTILDIKTVLSSALKDAVDDDLIPKNPVDKSKMPKFEKVLKEIDPGTYTIDQVKKLLDYAKENGSHIYPFLALVLCTGIRKGEAMAAKWTDLDFTSGTILINKSRSGTKTAISKQITTPKSDSSNRIIPLADIALEALKEEKARQDELKQIMGKSWKGEDYIILNIDLMPYANLSAINRVVNRLTDKAGLPRTTIHGFRHAVATILDSENTSVRDISVILGHSSVQTTERNYIDRIRKAKKENIDTLSNAFNKINY